MKQILILLIAFMSINCSAQCDGDVTAWAPSINLFSHQYPGVSIEGARLNQKSRIGASVGLAIAPIRYQSHYLRITDGKEERGIETITRVNANIWMEGLYKLRQVDYIYTLNFVGGGTFDGYTGPSAYGGVNIRFPRGYKAFFIQAVYRTDRVIWLRTGIYLP